MENSSNLIKKFLSFLMVVAVGVGIYFAVTHFFFNKPDTNRPYEIVNELTGSELYANLEEYLSSTSSVYSEAYEKANGYKNAASSGETKTELAYTIERLEKARELHTHVNTYVAYELRNILYLDQADELGELIGKLSNQLGNVKKSAERLNKTIEQTFEPYVKELGTDYSETSTAEYYNRYYLRSFTSQYLDYVYELAEFCSVSQDIIAYASLNLDTNEYKIQAYRVGTNWAAVCALDLRNAYEKESTNNENKDILEPDENGKVSMTAAKEELYALYVNYYTNKISSMKSNEELILNFETVSEDPIVYNSIELPDSYELFADNVAQVNVRDFFTHYFEIRTELNELGTNNYVDPNLPEEGEGTEGTEGEEEAPEVVLPDYVSRYLQTLEISEAKACKELIVRLQGVRS